MRIGAVKIPNILSDREKEIYKMRLQGLSLRKVATHFKVCPERIRQIEAIILRKLRKHDSLDPMDKISVRLRNALISNGIKTIQEAQSKTDYELLTLKCLGKKCLIELREFSFEGK
jgi:DNA-directed RNA polymerase alpha subunit